MPKTKDDLQNSLQMPCCFGKHGIKMMRIYYFSLLKFDMFCEIKALKDFGKKLSRENK
jgi:hypothetical protein